jgi:hypothetical protein
VLNASPYLQALMTHLFSNSYDFCFGTNLH